MDGDLLYLRAVVCSDDVVRKWGRVAKSRETGWSLEKCSCR